MQKNIDIMFVGDKNLFPDKYIKSLSKIANIIFCSQKSFIENITENKRNKIVVYDPDYAGWSFPDEILKSSENILAIFLGTTDKSYVNLKLCESKNINVYSIPMYSSQSVAEYLVMYMFACAKKIPMQIKNNNKQDFSDNFIQMQLVGKKVGIVGLGNIGKKLAEICDGIGMDVCYWNRTKKQTNYEYTSLSNLFKTCDVIYICLQVNDETKKLITDDLLKNLKHNAIFISCTGKRLFNYKIIEKKVANNELFGYAIDEPDTLLSGYKGNVMVTSEYGWFTEETIKLRINKWYENIVNYLCSYLNISSEKFLFHNKVDKENKNIVVNIQKAKEEDVPAIVKLYKEENWLGDSNSAEKIIENYDYNSKNNFLLVAKYKNKVVGTVTFSINKAFAFNCMGYIVFDYLVVDKKYRRLKVGKQLMDALISIAKNNKIESICGVSSSGRNKAHKFYEYVGFDDPVKGFRKVFIDE